MIRQEIARDPWRRRCPNGHTSWALFKSGEYRYTCRTCGWGGDTLVDWKEDGPEVAHAD